MDYDQDRKSCGTCNDWNGKREKVGDKCRMSPSAKGLCDRLKKQKPPHGGCNEWKKWETDE